MTATTIVTSRFSMLAVASLALGLASLLLLLVTGIPALFLGYYGLRSVNLSDGRLRGRWAAAAGMILGGLSCFVSLVLLGALAVNHLGEKSRGAECKNNLRRFGLALGVTDPFQPGALFGAALLLAVAGFIACLIPALRAGRTDPVLALRAE